jgi:hypothetical protein
MSTELAERVVLGIELESYTIQLPDYRIGREIAFPRKGLGEKGERFARDWSIGTEYNSRPFHTIREGLFLVRAGLRKYSVKLYRRKTRSRKGRQLLLVGGWRDRFAGAHIHLSIAGETLSRERARHLAWHLHDHIPLFIALGANSPVWADEITDLASVRIVKASDTYFRAVRRGELRSRWADEMLFSPGRQTKPPTLELRVLDANVPEFVLAVACLVKAAALGWLGRKGAINRLSHANYLRTRADAAERGMRARLYWNGDWVSVPRYLDRFVWAYRDEIASMDVPQELWAALKLLKKGYNGSRVLAAAARLAHAEHPQTWQRRFAKRYVIALDRLLSGNSIVDFVERMNVTSPALDGVWLGRQRLRLA